ARANEYSALIVRTTCHTADTQPHNSGNSSGNKEAGFHILVQGRTENQKSGCGGIDCIAPLGLDNLASGKWDSLRKDCKRPPGESMNRHSKIHSTYSVAVRNPADRERKKSQH